MVFVFTAIFLIAHLVALYGAQLPSAELLAAGFVLVMVLLAVILRGRTSAQLPVLALVACCGYLNAASSAHQGLRERWPGALHGSQLTVDGTVASMPVSAGDSLSFLIDQVHPLAPAPHAVPRRIQVSWFRSARVPQPGERWRLDLRLRAPGGQLNPGGADPEGWYLRNRIGARGSVVQNRARRLTDEPPGKPLLRWRASLAATIARSLDGHPMVGIITGLAVGMRHNIDAQQWSLLRRTGTGHLVAISGLHVGLVAGLVLWLARQLWSRSEALCRKVTPIDAAWILACLAAASYAALAGFSLPTRRALLMLVLFCGAALVRRSASGTRVLCLALGLCLVFDPLCVLSPGFWLSFTAVSALVVIARRTRVQRLRMLVVTQLSLFAALLPVSMAAFGQVAPVSPLANLIMIPLFSILFIPLVLIGVLAALVWEPLGTALLTIVAALLGAGWRLLEALGQVQILPVPLDYRWLLVMLSGVIASVLLLPRWPGRGLLLAAGLWWLMHLPTQAPLSGGLELTVLDTGHALSVVVRTRNHALVYDLGKGAGERGTVARTLLPYLAAMGVRRPDLLLLSHSDPHHFGDLRFFIRQFPATAVLSGAPSAARELLGHDAVRPCNRGQQWHWDGVRFEILQPGREILWEDDDSSCVLRITSRAGVILISGDLGVRGEARLLARYPQLQADVVIGLAHGSRRASSRALVKRLRPRLVVFATSANNPWGLPAPEVIRRWQQTGAQTASTGSQGAVTVRMANDLHYQFARGRRFWHGQ